MGNICGKFLPYFFGVYPFGYIKGQKHYTAVLNFAQLKLINSAVDFAPCLGVSLFLGFLLNVIHIVFAVNRQKILVFAICPNTEKLRRRPVYT